MSWDDEANEQYFKEEWFQPDFWKSITSSDFFKGVQSLLGGKSGLGSAGSFLGAGALGLLGDKLFGGGGSGPAGYQGGVPMYTASFTQTPFAQQRPEGYVPGQGGITYFNPIQYTYQGQDLGAPTSTITVPAPAPAPAPAPSPANPNRPDRPRPERPNRPFSNASGGYMDGGIAMLAGGGNRFLRGAGDGVSDSIAAKFDKTGQPARLADGEFVIDARTVSELGNGSSEAGARKLYAMLDRVHAMRKKAKRGKPSGADRELKKLVRR